MNKPFFYSTYLGSAHNDSNEIGIMGTKTLHAPNKALSKILGAAFQGHHWNHYKQNYKEKSINLTSKKLQLLPQSAL